MSPKKVVPPILLLGAIGAGIWWYTTSRTAEAEDGLAASGTVEATEAQLGFQVPGQISALDVREGDRVRAGQVLARLDPVEAEARRAQVAAQVAGARAQLAELEAGSRREEVAQARAALDVAQDREADARRDLERNRMLFDGGAIPREALDKSRLAVEVAGSQRTQAAEQLRLVQAGPRRERVDAARAQLAQAEAALRASEASLENLTLTAPFDGVVTVRHREPGEIVVAGAPVLTLMDPGSRWVRIYIKEDRLGEVRIGAPAAIRSDTFPDKRYQGQVSFIASEAEFTPKSVQTTEERVRLVYEVKVRVTGDPANELKPGLPADVTLETAKGREG
ncbi:MAG TPA: HlyD family efflux transporter periplasmic adaptor subunit [Thermoanaerobaculia bacterium]|nr:HlyD family efflux transporter periplasmic adaptor subunit [Thermoanaerobaculia bacterium]